VSAVQDWINSVESTLKGLKNAGSFDAASRDAINGLDTATNQLENSLEQFGNIERREGPERHREPVHRVQQPRRQCQTRTRQPTERPVGIASIFAQIGSDAHETTTEIKSTATTLKGLASSGQLKRRSRTRRAASH
jgi:hypothetical protein